MPAAGVNKITNKISAKTKQLRQFDDPGPVSLLPLQFLIHLDQMKLHLLETVNQPMQKCGESLRKKLQN